jgi:hypothetical protein
LLAVFFCFAIPQAGFCCEPILPLYQLLAGASLVGPALISESLIWLAVAVVIKTGTFVFFERDLSWGQSVLFMILANVVSTVPGVLLAAFASSGTGIGIVLSLPVIFVLGWMVQQRIELLPSVPGPLSITAGKAMFLFAGIFLVFAILHHLATRLLDAGGYAGYWLLKFLFVTLVATTGMIISAVLEECVIARLAWKSAGNLSFYPAVFRANYVTLVVVLFAAAIKMLPKRLESPHFITAFFDSLLVTLGLA